MYLYDPESRNPALTRREVLSHNDVRRSLGLDGKFGEGEVNDEEDD